MNETQGTKPDVRQWNRFLDEVVTILKYKKSKIDHDIYIKLFSDETVAHLTIYTDNVLNTNNNDTTFTEPTRFYEEYSEMKVQ